MRKITLFLSALFALAGITTAKAQAITSLDDLSNNAAYVIKSARGYMIYDADKSANTAWCTGRDGSYTIDETKANFQWAIITTEKGRFLYNVGCKKFLYKNGKETTLTDAPIAKDVNFLASTGGENGAVHETYPWVVAFGTNQINMSKDQLSGILTDWNDTKDDGNMVAIEKVADFDPTEALEVIADVKPELKAKIAEFQAILAVTPYFYTAEAFAAANNAIAAAQAVVDNEASTDEQEQAALDALVEAIAAFQPDAKTVETYNGLATYLQSIFSIWAEQLPDLITSADQLSSAYGHGTVNPTATSDNAGVEVLIDNDNATYFHTAYSGNVPTGHHNLEVKFDAPVGDFMFYIYARNSANSYSNDRPKTITVYGSTDDGANYTKIKTIDYPLPLPTNVTQMQSLWGIIEGGNYTKFRFDVEATNTNQAYFTMAEFQMYAKPEGAAELLEFMTAYSSIAKMEDIYTLAAEVKFPVTLNASGISGVGNLATFSAPIATAVPTGATAYFAKVEGDYVVLTALETGKAIPANEGVILESAETSLVMVPTTAEAADASANEFENTAAGAKAASAITNGYVLTDYNGVASFCKLASGTLAANKAYIVVADGSAAVRLVFGDEATGIESATVAQDANAPVYDLSGRLVKATKSGIYVSKGKKFIVK